MAEKNPNQVLLCSTLAGIICNSLTNPLDVIKVRLQNDAKKCHCTQPYLCVNRSSPISKSSCIGNASLLKIARCTNIESEYRVLCGCLPFKTNTRALVYLVRKEGLLTLANGMLQGVTSSTLSAVAFFSVYEAVRKEVAKVTQNAVLLPLYSALFARTVTTSLIFPFEYMKTVQQSSVGKNKVSAFKIGRSANAGFTSLLIRDIVFACVNWVLAENIRGQIKGVLQADATGYQDKKTLLISNFISGGIAGGIGSLVSIPFDVVKTRKQLHPKEYRHKSILQILREVYELEGRRGLFLGARQRVWKVTFQTAGILTLYEFFMDMMGNRQLEMKL